MNQTGINPASLFKAQQRNNSETISSLIIENIRTTLRPLVLKEAGQSLKEPPITITSFKATRSAGTVHDFFSEGDYWWPNPASADSPYIQKDGMTNPDNFTKHREAMIRFSRIVGSLVSAYKLTGEKKYLEAALRHCKAWFISSNTKMNPSLLYAQAIKGRATGRGIGIIDTIHLVEVAQSLMLMESIGFINTNDLANYKKWFEAYLQWLTTHPYGKEEMNAKNNHGTCWVMQVAAFAKFVQNKELLDLCVERYKNVLLPAQMAADGSFPLELRRTKPYGYSIFNLDAMTTICQLLSSFENNLWEYETPDGRSIRSGVDFLIPFIKDKESWKFPRDVMYWNNWPVAQPLLAFAAVAYNKTEWMEIWKRLDHAPGETEVIRNLPVRNMLLWLE